MHTPSYQDRVRWVKQIIDTIKDQIPFSVIKDENKIGAWYNAKRCWKKGITEPSTHHVVLQDDIIVCKDFVDTLRLCIETFPDNPICLYANRKICEQAKEQNVRWVMIPDGVWGQGIVLPKKLIKDFLEWEEKHIDPSFKHDDSRLAMFCVENKIEVMCPMPSLINHAGATKSILGQSNPNKIARWYVENKSYLEYNWKDKNYLKGTSGLSKGYYKYYNG